jgi:hypothetical protein
METIDPNRSTINSLHGRKKAQSSRRAIEDNVEDNSFTLSKRGFLLGFSPNRGDSESRCLGLLIGSRRVFALASIRSNNSICCCHVRRSNKTTSTYAPPSEGATEMASDSAQLSMATKRRSEPSSIRSPYGVFHIYALQCLKHKQLAQSFVSNFDRKMDHRKFGDSFSCH